MDSDSENVNQNGRVGDGRWKKKIPKISESREAVEFYFIAFKMSYIVVGKALA